MTPHHLLLFAKADISSVNLCFATTEEYEQELALLSSRFAGTHKLHYIRPMSAEQVEVKKFWNSCESRAEHVIQPESADIPQSVDRPTDHQAVTLADLKGYITPKYDGNRCVMLTFAEQNEVEINLMHPHWCA
jgi:hypothetical protein